MTRATLLAPPYQVQDGRWRAAVRTDMRAGDTAIITLPENFRDLIAEDLRPGDTIKVTREGDEWRAV